LGLLVETRFHIALPDLYAAARTIEELWYLVYVDCAPSGRTFCPLVVGVERILVTNAQSALRDGDQTCFVP